MHQSQKGTALVMVIGFTSVLLIIGIVASQVIINSFRFGANEKAMTRAFYAAEAGGSHVIGRLKIDTLSISAKKSAAQLGFLTQKPSNANFGADLGYWIPNLLYDPHTPPTWVEIESRGTVMATGMEQGIITHLSLVTDSPFQWGIFADKSIEISGGANVDSYNSEEGPWTLQTRGTNGNTGTNSISNAAITMTGSSRIYGSANVGPGGDPATAINTWGPDAISGSRTALTNPVDMTPKSAPSALTPLRVNPGDTISAGGYEVSNFSLSGGAMVRISGQVTMNVTGDFVMSGSSQLIIEPTASLTLYVSGNLNVSGGSIINQSTQPKNCQIFGTASCTTVIYSGGSAFYGAIYAPKAAATISGGSGVFGSIIADSIRFSGGGIHYDEALAKNGGKIIGLKMDSWRWL